MVQVRSVEAELNRVERALESKRRKDIDDLKRQMEEMQKRLDRLSSKDKG